MTHFGEYGTLCTKKGQSENDRIPTALFCVTVLFLFIFDCLIDTNASDYNKIRSVQMPRTFLLHLPSAII